MPISNTFTDTAEELVNQEMQALLESLPDSAFIMDLEGTILNINTIFAGRFGRQPQECIGSSIFDLISDVLGLSLITTYLRKDCDVVFQTGKSQVFENDFDSWKVTINPVRSSSEVISRLFIIIQDISAQKQYKQQLEKKNALSNALLDAIPCSAIILDSKFRLMASNRYTRETLFSSDEDGSIVESPEKFFCMNDMAPLREMCMDTIRSGNDSYCEMEIRPHGGPETSWLMTRSQRLLIDGEPCLASIGFDITERKKIEQDLACSKEKLSMALQASRAGIWELDTITREFVWTDEVWNLYGLDKASGTPSTKLWKSVVHPDDIDRCVGIVSRAMQQLDDIEIEYRVNHADGTSRWLLSRGKPTADEQGKPTRYHGTVIDITERKKIELALIDSKNRLGQALEAARAGVWEWNTATNENIWSEEIWALYGIKHRKDTTPSFELWANSIHPEDRVSTMRLVNEAANRQTALYIEYRVQHKDQSVHWLMARGKPIVDEHGGTLRYIGTIIDITERKLAELAHKESEKRLNFALEATNAGVWEWDLKTDKVTWSDQIWNMYGIRPLSVDPSHLLCETMVYPDDREKTFAQITSATSRNTEFSVEYRVGHPDNSIHWLHCHGVPLPGNNDQILCYHGTVMDVTEKRKADEELLESQTILNFIVSKSHLGVWELNLADHKAIRSFEHARIFGYVDNSGPWSVEMFLNHIVQEDRQRIEKLLEESFEKKENYTFECRICTTEGWIRWIWVFGAFDSNSQGNARHLYGIIQDITERKRTELLMQENEQKFRNIFEFSPIAIGIEDPDNATLCDVNTSWLRLFGYSTKEAVGHNVKDIGIYAYPEDHDHIVSALRENGRIFNRPIELRNKTGDIVTVMLSAEFITMNNETLMLVMMTDITVQEHQQESISQLEKIVTVRTEELRREVERLQRFMNMISHEYRTPLAIIRGNLNLIELKHENCDHDNDREIAKIKRAIERLVEVMEVSIHESRILESPKPMPAETFEIEPIISSQIEAFIAMWPERAIRLTGHLDEAITCGEAAQLKMAIFNLLDNAHKYSSPGTVIDIECGLEDGNAIITIRNQCKETDELEGEELFEKYRRGGNAANTGGAGLGLWLVKNIVEHHHGQVSLNHTASDVEVVVTLPLVKDQHQTEVPI